jgi:hypothetical protein
MLKTLKVKNQEENNFKLWNDPYIPMPELLKESADQLVLKTKKLSRHRRFGFL